MNLKSISLTRHNTIKDAIDILVKFKSQIVLIVDKKQTLHGTVTDGDIRRSLAAGKSLNFKLAKVMNNKPITVSENSHISKVNTLMKTNSILQIPEIDRNKKILKLHFWNGKIISKKKNIFFILAGGLGKRLWPLTKNTPKPMLKIGNQPILEHIILNAKNFGFNNFYISIFFKKEKIIKYFKNGKNIDIDIKYLIEKKPLGTAGSLRLINKRNKLPIVVVNGDVLSNINFSDLINFHNKNKAMATMVIKEINQTNPYGIIKSKGIAIESIIEKPTQKININTGIYIINPKALKFIPNKKFDMTELFHSLKQNKKKIIIYPAHEDWVDIGLKKDFIKAKSKKK